MADKVPNKGPVQVPAKPTSPPPQEGSMPQDDGGMGTERPIPYSAQLWQRIREDLEQLLQEYHELGLHLEHGPSQKLLMKILQNKVSALDAIDAHAAQHYPDLGLFADADPMTEEGKADDMGSPEEAVPSASGEEPMDGDFAGDGIPGEEDEDEVPAEEAVAGMRTKGFVPSFKKDKTKDTAKSKEKGLFDDDKRSMKECCDFLKEIGQTGTRWKDEKRFQAYHYGKTLEAIAAKYLPTEGEKSLEEKDEKSIHSLCNDCSKYLKELSSKSAYTFDCMQKSINWHKELNNLLSPVDENAGMIDDKDMAEVPEVVGEMGEKDLMTTVLQSNEHHSKMIDQIISTINNIPALLQNA